MKYDPDKNDKYEFNTETAQIYNVNLSSNFLYSKRNNEITWKSHHHYFY